MLPDIFFSSCCFSSSIVCSCHQVQRTVESCNWASDSMEEKLSSSATFYYKVIFPTLWIGMFGLGTLGLWLGIFNQPTLPPLEIKYIFLIAWIIGSSFILSLALRLKSVSLMGDYLVIKNFNRTIQAPIRNMKKISESRFINPKTISLTFYPPSEFGEKISFIPKAKYRLTLNPFSEHPIVTKLRELTKIQRWILTIHF